MRHAVVTGAAEGIGRAVGEVLGAHGYALAGVDINAALAAQTQQAFVDRGLDVTFLLGDLGRPADLDRIATSLAAGPAIDVLVHSAGINCVGAFAQSDLARQQAVLDVNLRAPLHLTARCCVPAGWRTGGRSCLSLRSRTMSSYPGAAVYGAGKDGLASYARSLSLGACAAGHQRVGRLPGAYAYGARAPVQPR